MKHARRKRDLECRKYKIVPLALAGPITAIREEAQPVALEDYGCLRADLICVQQNVRIRSEFPGADS